MSRLGVGPELRVAFSPLVVVGASMALMAPSMAACGPSRDVAGPTSSMTPSMTGRTGAEALGPGGVGTRGTPGAGSGQGYAFVARRALATLAVGEVVGIAEEPARAALEALAEAFETCAEGLVRDGKLVSGAGRAVASVSREGTVETVALTVSPGDAVKANALLCLVAPVKLLAFPASQDRSTDRVFLVEAVWGPPSDGRAPGGK